MNSKIGIIGILFLVLLTAGCISGQTQTAEKDAMVKEGDAMEKTDDAMEKKDDSMMEKGEVMEKKEGETMIGKKSFYIPFTQAEYEKAKTEGKIIFLEFYANWCPICKAQEPEIEEAFSTITQENVAGFRVNYNDSDTDADEQALAKQFGIAYQHTHVILDADGTVKTKSLENWDSERILQELISDT